MQIRHYSLILFLAFVFLSCSKENITTFTVEGVVRDDASNKPIGGVTITVDGVRSPSGMGIISDGKRETVGRAKTDANGYYKVKFKLFIGAERLEFFLDPGELRNKYGYDKQGVYLSDIDGSASNKKNFALSPIALLQVKFKNANPVSDSDFFYFGYTTKGNGATKGVLVKENCGTIPVSEALTWTGKDVCGIFTIGTFAERYTTVYWIVKKYGVIRQQSDSVFVKRNEVNEFLLNY